MSVEKSQGIGHIVPENETFGHLIEEHGRESSSCSDFLTLETTGIEEHSHSGYEDSSSPSSLSWSTRKADGPDCIRLNVPDKVEKIMLLIGSWRRKYLHHQVILILFPLWGFSI